MENFEFKSQVATSIELSKRLLELGLKKENADCHWFYHDEHWEIKIGFDLMSCENLYPKYYIPAWSLHRIIELIEYNTNIDAIKELLAAKEMFANNLYTAFINIIEYLIQKDEFNKDYLEEKV